jgi:hypothetical protein
MFMSAISDIDIISVIPISEKICLTENCHSNIGNFSISTLKSIPISDIEILFPSTHGGIEPTRPGFTGVSALPLGYYA